MDENMRWLGTTFLAAAFGLVALAGIIWLAQAKIVVPDVLTTIAAGAAGGFFTAFGSMVGARASQNGQQVSNGQPLSGGGMH